MGIFDIEENIENLQPLAVKVFKLLEIAKEGYIQGRWIDARDDPEKYQGYYFNWHNKITHPDFDDVWIQIRGMNSTKSLPSRYRYKWEEYVDKSFHTYMKELGVVKAYKNRYIPDDVIIIKNDNNTLKRCSKMRFMCDVMLYDNESFAGRNYKKYVIDNILNDKNWYGLADIDYIEMFPGLFCRKGDD